MKLSDQIKNYHVTIKVLLPDQQSIYIQRVVVPLLYKHVDLVCGIVNTRAKQFDTERVSKIIEHYFRKGCCSKFLKCQSCCSSLGRAPVRTDWG